VFNGQYSRQPPIPCEQFAYDNPPRLIKLPEMPRGEPITFDVRNTSGAPCVFRATIWAEPPALLSSANSLREAIVQLRTRSAFGESE
jgi:hypothetical protein